MWLVKLIRSVEEGEAINQIKKIGKAHTEISSLTKWKITCIERQIVYEEKVFIPIYVYLNTTATITTTTTTTVTTTTTITNNNNNNNNNKRKRRVWKN